MLGVHDILSHTLNISFILFYFILFYIVLANRLWLVLLSVTKFGLLIDVIMLNS